VTQAAAIPKGTVIDGYEVVDILGRGGMGAVYRVRRGDAEYALKALTLSSTADASEAIARFKREAELLASLHHRGIVRVNTAGHKPGFSYFVMRLVDGESLEARLKRAGPLPREEAVAIVLEVADAIAHAHEKGIVHRDLKPSNILVDRETGQPLVTDFGLARRLGESDADRLTQTGEVMGTPAYVAPEQARGSKQELDEKTDVYGLGALLYALLSARAPFEGPSALAIMKNVTTEPPAPLPEVAPDLGDFVIERAMAKDRRDRPSSAVAFREELEAICGGGSSGSKRAWFFLGAGVVCAAAFLLAALALKQDRPSLGTTQVAHVVSTTTNDPTLFPNADAEIRSEYEKAFARSSVADQAGALLSIKPERIPKRGEIRARAASILMQDAIAAQGSLHEALKTADLSILVGDDPESVKIRGEWVGLLERTLRSFARWHELAPEPDLMPDALADTFLYLDVFSRNEAYKGVRGTGWDVRWEGALAEEPNHPTLCFVRAATALERDDHRRAIEEAQKAWKALEAFERRPFQARVLAFHFGAEVLRWEDRALCEQFLRYANYSDESMPWPGGETIPPLLPDLKVLHLLDHK